MSSDEFREALRTFHASDDEENAGPLRALLLALVETELLVVDDGELAYEETEDDRIYLALFTDPIEAHTYGAEGQVKPMKAERAIELVLKGEYGGLVINPAGQRFSLSAEDVADFFEVDAGLG